MEDLHRPSSLPTQCNRLLMFVFDCLQVLSNSEIADIISFCQVCSIPAHRLVHLIPLLRTNVVC